MAEQSKIASAILRDCFFLNDGFAATKAGDKWRLGAVCIARSENGLSLLVQKAVKTGEQYEFSGKWSFPGGMLRAEHSEEAKPGDEVRIADLAATLSNRLTAETGLKHEDISRLELAHSYPPLVTSYTAKGSRRYTLIIPFFADLNQSATVGSADRSIFKAQWRKVDDAIEQMAPANSIYAMLFSNQSVAAITSSEAWRECRSWANEAQCQAFLPGSIT